MKNKKLKKVLNIIFDIVIVIIIIALYVFSAMYLYTNFRERKRLEISNGIIEKVDNIIKKNKEIKKSSKENEKEIVNEAVVSYNDLKYTILGKVIINKININEPILKENTKGAMDTAVVLIAGPSLNSYGNVVLGGHNYMKGDYFIKINKLINDDVITVTDLTGNSVNYYVYDFGTTAVSDISYLKQPDNENDRILTLVTCTKGAAQRYYVKAKAK